LNPANAKVGGEVRHARRGLQAGPARFHHYQHQVHAFGGAPPQVLDARFHVRHEMLPVTQQQVAEHFAQQDVFGTRAAAPAALDGSHYQHADAIHHHSELLRNVVHPRVHFQEAAPSLAAADSLFDQCPQLDQGSDRGAAIAQRPRQVGVGIRVHGDYGVTQVPPAAGQSCRYCCLAHPALAGHRDLHDPISHSRNAWPGM